MLSQTSLNKFRITFFFGLLWLCATCATQATAQIGKGTEIGESVVGRSSFSPAILAISTLPKCQFGPMCSPAGCTEYIFIGTGDWLIPGNWANGNIPPDKLPDCYKIIIDPPTGEKAVLSTPLTMMKGSDFIVAAGKILIIPGKVIIGQ
jgi:hypothetical protein